MSLKSFSDIKLLIRNFSTDYTIAFLSPSCVVNCPEGMFLCPTENICIAGGLRCNGIPDCASGADEQSCEGRYIHEV